LEMKGVYLIIEIALGNFAKILFILLKLS